MKIEEKAVKHYGLTENFESAGYILPNGDMLNFSEDWFCGTRTQDHRNVSQFFTHAIGTDAMVKFMKRGSIRVMCNRDTYCFEFVVKPSEKQMAKLKQAFYRARRGGKSFYVERTDKTGWKVKRTYYEEDFFYDYE